MNAAKSESMRQNPNMPTTSDSDSASTCCFFTRKRRCARGFRNLPHTSGGRFRKCGVKPRSADQTPVLGFRDLRFCWRKSGCARRFSIFPRTSEIRGPVKRVLATLAASAAPFSSSGNIKGPLPENRTTTLLCHRLTLSPRRLHH